MWRIRSLIEDGKHQYLTSDRFHVGFDPEAEVWLDIDREGALEPAFRAITCRDALRRVYNRLDPGISTPDLDEARESLERLALRDRRALQPQQVRFRFDPTRA